MHHLIRAAASLSSSPLAVPGPAQCSFVLVTHFQPREGSGWDWRLWWLMGMAVSWGAGTGLFVSMYTNWCQHCKTCQISWLPQFVPSNLDGEQFCTHPCASRTQSCLPVHLYFGWRYKGKENLCRIWFIITFESAIQKPERKQVTAANDEHEVRLTCKSQKSVVQMCSCHTSKRRRIVTCPDLLKNNPNPAFLTASNVIPSATTISTFPLVCGNSHPPQSWPSVQKSVPLCLTTSSNPQERANRCARRNVRLVLETSTD